jgi:periplasmic copper chaperone A
MRSLDSLKTAICVLIIGLLALSAKAEVNHAKAEMHHAKKSDIQAHMGWVRAVPPVAVTTAAYMMLHNYSKRDDRVISIETSVAEAAEIHTSEISNGTMKMLKLEDVTVPAKGHIMFEPAGYHIMLINLKQPLKVGDMVPLTLIFEDHGRIDMRLPVSHPPEDSKHEGMSHSGHDMNH